MGNAEFAASVTFLRNLPIAQWGDSSRGVPPGSGVAASHPADRHVILARGSVRGRIEPLVRFG